jgi:uncharacterized protein (TIGR02145 family)/uncharacterized repeat protein (TIGR02543 family)
MVKNILIITNIIVFLSALFLITCGPLPTDPALDPSNVNVHFLINGNTSGIIQDKQIDVGIIITYPHLTKSIKVSFGDSIADQTIYCTKTTTSAAETLFVQCTYKSIHTQTITANVELSNNMFKPFSYSFDVLPKLTTVVFDTIPKAHLIAVNEQDTLKFTAFTDPPGGNILFTAISFPALDTNHLKTIVQGSGALIIVKGVQKGLYKIICYSQSGTAYDTAIVELTAYNKPVFSETFKVEKLNPGTTDTLLFTAKSDSTDTLEIKLTNSSNFNSGVVTVLPTATDSLKVVFTPDEAKTYLFSIVISGKYSIDTIIVQKVVKAIDTTNQDSVPPVFSQKSGPKSGERVKVAVGSISFSVSDSSGIEAINCKLNGTVLTGVTNIGTDYTLPFTLSVYDSNRIVVYASDKSAAHNSDSMVIVLYYNTSVTAAVASAPANNATGVDVLPTFSWTGGDDTDGDSVFYKVLYGTDTAMLNLQSAVVTQKSVKLTKNLSADTKYWWKVIACSKEYSDTTRSEVFSFTTISDDNVSPVITLVSPAKDSSSVSSSNVNVDVKCTDDNGIATVTCMFGSKSVDVSKGTGNIYTAAVIGLISGENKLVFAANDNSSNQNSAIKTVTIIYDPTITDNVAPSISLKNPKTNEERVETDTFTVQITCKDDNGIASVAAIRAAKALSVTNSNDSIYSVKLTALTAGKSDTVTFTVIDKSTNANAKEYSVIIKYDRNLGDIILTSPANNATGITSKPTFTWTGGEDPDGSAVTYTVKYGTSSSSLTKSIPGLTSKTTTLTSGLIANTDYYWQVISNSEVNSDVVASDIWMFTTVESAPVISKDPSDTSVVVGSKATFSVTATGTNPKYQWQKGTENVTTGGTTSNYTTTTTTSADNGTTYRCIVSNRGGSDTSAAAILTIQYSVTYEGNENSSGAAPIDANVYSMDEMVTVKAVTGLGKNGYKCVGWNTSADGKGTSYTGGSTFKMGSVNVVLYANWIAVYTVTFDGQGATTEASPATKNFTASSTVGTLPTAPDKTSYIFAGWYTGKNGSGTPFTASTVVSANTTVYAKWEIRDADGNVYTEVKIGNQVWMVENLRTTKYNDGTAITLDISLDNWENDVTGKYCYNENTTNAVNIKKFGAFYNWNAVNTGKLAPTGWHVPTATEWNTLRDFLIANGYNHDGTTADNKIAKSMAAKTDWATFTTNGTIGSDLTANNYSGFSALPGGKRDCCASNPWSDSGTFASWWSASMRDATSAEVVYIRYDSESFNSGSTEGSGRSVRLVRD